MSKAQEFLQKIEEFDLSTYIQQNPGKSLGGAAVGGAVAHRVLQGGLRSLAKESLRQSGYKQHPKNPQVWVHPTTGEMKTTGAHLRSR